MTATVDANILVYASDESSEFHDRALALVSALAQGPALVYLFWPVAMGYVRISTHPTIFQKPLTVAEAIANLDDLVCRSHVRTAGEADGFWTVLREVTDATLVRGNLVPDAHIVALMRQHGVATIWSHDRDFFKFPGITVRDPFA